MSRWACTAAEMASVESPSCAKSPLYPRFGPPAVPISGFVPRDGAISAAVTAERDADAPRMPKGGPYPLNGPLSVKPRGCRGRGGGSHRGGRAARRGGWRRLGQVLRARVALGRQLEVGGEAEILVVRRLEAIDLVRVDQQRFVLDPHVRIAFRVADHAVRQRDDGA